MKSSLSPWCNSLYSIMCFTNLVTKRPVQDDIVTIVLFPVLSMKQIGVFGGYSPICRWGLTL